MDLHMHPSLYDCIWMKAHTRTLEFMQEGEESYVALIHHTLPEEYTFLAGRIVEPAGYDPFPRDPLGGDSHLVLHMETTSWLQGVAEDLSFIPDCRPVLVIAQEESWYNDSLCSRLMSAYPNSRLAAMVCEDHNQVSTIETMSDVIALPNLDDHPHWAAFHSPKAFVEFYCGLDVDDTDADEIMDDEPFAMTVTLPEYDPEIISQFLLTFPDYPMSSEEIIDCCVLAERWSSRINHSTGAKTQEHLYRGAIIRNE